GTSMLTSFLKQLGLQTGWSRGNDEAYFFHKLNLYLERVCNCGWDNPRPFLSLMECKSKKNQVIDHLQKSLRWPKSTLFYGPRGILLGNTVEAINGAWGWKDPRNTFTAQIWQEIFPKAKFIHIYRNGVDVAASLREREVNSPPRLMSVYSSPRVCTLEGGFSLWEEYIEQAFSIQSMLGEQGILHVRFEDFMERPYDTLDSIVQFCGLQTDDDVIQKTSQLADPKRSCAFLNNKDAADFYSKVKNRRWMRELGFDDL
ncbi:sulfotransferase, partial [Lutibacter sp.]|uniref:sulfotransferase family protein n=1 Tax=Lutibacter sp. TaxID=1925666 RepID=UPI0025B9E06C